MTRTSASARATGPVSGAERYESLDLLRGVGVLGILVMNVYAFSMPYAAYTNPLVMGGQDPLNMGTWFLTHILFDQKFMSIFSMLFGAGIVLMGERARAARSDFRPVFFRRQGWLMVIGLLHGYLIWFGDILFFYAVIGVLAYAFRNSTPKVLVAGTCALLPVAMLLSFFAGMTAQDLENRVALIEAQQVSTGTISADDRATVEEWRALKTVLEPGADEVAAAVKAYKGSYSDALRYRIPEAASFQVDGLLFYMIWRVGGLMLLGMAFMKLGILTGARSPIFYRKLALVGYIVGLPMTIFSAFTAYRHSFDAIYLFKFGAIPNYIGSIFVAFGHIGLVMLVAKHGLMASFARRVAAAGRMALTNYLGQSIVMTGIFYGYGLGLYGQVERTGQMALVAGLVAMQLLLSSWWLSRFRFGPAEWCWRSLTYWKRQPMRRTG